MICKNISCTKALNRLKKPLPYEWDLNIYRGCAHRCLYCYARYSHSYLKSSHTNPGGDNFFRTLYVKDNLPELLEKELPRLKTTRSFINIGGVTDSYQPAEKEYKLMRDVLKVFIRHPHPVIISTKSDLIIRDLDLIDELSQKTCVNLAVSLVTMNKGLQKKMESGAAPPEARLQVIKEAKKTNCSLGVHMMPIIPLLTDSDENLSQIVMGAKEAGAHYLLPGTLYFRKDYLFMNFIQRAYPTLFTPFQELYRGGRLNRDYKNSLYKRLNGLLKKYDLSTDYQKVMNSRLPEERDLQLSLF